MEENKHFNKIYDQDFYDQMNHMSIQSAEVYANQKQVGNLLKITGYLEATKKRMVWHATRKDMVRWFALAEKSRWDRKYGLEKQDAIARWVTGKTPKAIPTRRPSEFMAKRTTRYYPKPGSSAGKVGTKIIGDAQVERDFRKMMEAIFNIGANMPNIGVKRTITKTLK